MTRHNYRETKTEVLRGKIEIIKTAYPKLFENTSMLTTLLNTATAINSLDITPYYFQGETTAIAPFNRFSFKYETYETLEKDNIKKRWKLLIGFSKIKDESNSYIDLAFLYMGDREGETQQPQPADKLFLHFLSAKTRVIFDLKNRKIGFADASDKISY